MTKQEIRTQKLIDRRNLDTEEVINSSLDIATKLFETDEFQNAQIVHIYKSTPIEVSTIEIINKCFELGKRVIIPKTKANSKHTQHIEIFVDTIFEKLYFGVLIPTDNYKVFDLSSMARDDLFVVPVVAYDSKHNRIGYGKGCYDRFLGTVKCHRIGLAFSCQKVARIEPELHDVKLHKVICE